MYVEVDNNLIKEEIEEAEAGIERWVDDDERVEAMKGLLRRRR